MSEEMSDKDLIGYCEIHCTTERALFHSKHINRMLELAGHPDNFTAAVRDGWYPLHGEMKELCHLARVRNDAANNSTP